MFADPVGTGPISSVFLVGDGDGLEDNPAAGGKQLIQGRKVHRQVGMADSLEHLDGDDLAEAALDMAVIGEEDCDPVRQPFFLHPPGSPVELFAGNRDAR